MYPTAYSYWPLGKRDLKLFKICPLILHLYNPTSVNSTTAYPVTQTKNLMPYLVPLSLLSHSQAISNCIKFTFKTSSESNQSSPLSHPHHYQPEPRLWQKAFTLASLFQFLPSSSLFLASNQGNLLNHKSDLITPLLKGLQWLSGKHKVNSPPWSTGSHTTCSCLPPASAPTSLACFQFF